MKRDEIRARLAEVVNSVVTHPVDPAVVKEDSRLREDLRVNSIEANEVVFTIEEIFGIEFQDDEVLKLRTVADVIDRIEEKTQGR